MYAKGRSIFFYEKVNQSSGTDGLLYQREDFINKEIVLSIAYDTVRTTNVTSTIQVTSNTVFNINNTPNTQSDTSRELYFAMNRVIANSERSGSGLCWVQISWSKYLH